MRIIDAETVPYLTIPQTLVYFTWLFKEIIKANIAVHILVHALLSEMSDPSDFDDMAERSAWAIGEDIDVSQSRGAAS